MIGRLLCSAVLAVAGGSCCPPLLAQPGPLEEPAVEVRKVGGEVIVEASIKVPASIVQAWEVLTDYDHMAGMFSSLHSSRVVAKTEKSIQVEQKGSFTFGPFSLPFESMREIEFKPFEEIRSRSIGGSLKHGMAVTRLTSEADGVRISYHSQSVPAAWTPPGIGLHFVARETRHQFESLRNEILKRKGG